MDINTLGQIVNNAFTGQQFSLVFANLRNVTASEAALNLFPEGKLVLGAAKQKKLPPKEGDGYLIEGTGMLFPFKDTAITLTLKLSGSTCIPTLKATGSKTWTWVQTLPVKGSDLLLNLPPDLLNNVVLSTSFAHTEEEGTHVDLRFTLQISKASSELSDLLGVQSLDFSGALGYKSGGTQVAKLECAYEIRKSIGLDTFSLLSPRAGLGGMFSLPVEGEATWLIHSYFFIRATLQISVNNKPVSIPVQATLFGWGDSVEFSVIPDELADLTVEALVQLGDKTGIHNVLPPGFRLSEWIRILEMRLRFDLLPMPAFQQVVFTLSQNNPWVCYTFPSGRQIRIENVQVEYAVRSTNTGLLSLLSLSGSLSIGGGLIRMNASIFEGVVSFWLDEEEENLKIGALAAEWLSEFGIDWLPGMDQFVITDLNATFSLKDQLYYLSLNFGDEADNMLGNNRLGVNGFLNFSYDSEETPRLKLEGGGSIYYKGIQFSLIASYTDRIRFTASARDLRLSAILTAWTGEALPEGMPDLISDELTLSISSDTSFSIQGDLRVASQKLNLAGNEIVLVRADFRLEYSPERLSVEIGVRGNPDWELTPGFMLHTYSLRFSYDKEKTTGTAWKLGGDLDFTCFGTRRIQVAAAWSSSPQSRQLLLQAGAQTLHAPLTAQAFTRVEGVTEADATAIFSSLQSAGILDSTGRATAAFTPWDPAFSWTPPQAHTDRKDALLDIVAGQDHFFDLQVEGERVLTFDPHALRLEWKQENGQSTWTFNAVTSLQFYTPFTGTDPVLRLRYGAFAFTRNAAAQETQFHFTAREASISLFELNYKDVTAVREPGGEMVTEDKCFKARFNLGKFSFEKKGTAWMMGCDSSFRFEDMPAVLRHVLEDEIRLGVNLKKGEAEFYAQNGLKSLEIPDLLAPLAQEAGIQLPPLGLSAVKLTRLSLRLGTELTLSLEGGIGLPEKGNEALGFSKRFLRTYIPGQDDSLITGRLSLGTGGIQGMLLNSPFEKLEGIEDKTDHYLINLDTLTGEPGVGEIKVNKPKLEFSVQKGTFRLAAGYEILRGIALPTGPLKAFLRLIQLPDLAAALPRTVRVDSFDLRPAALKKSLQDTGLNIPQPFMDALDKVDEFFRKLPTALQAYADISLPEKLSFDLNITPDGGVSFNLEAPGKPLQWLMPTPTALVGYQLSRIDFGTTLGGNLLKLELSMKAESFDYLSLAAALFLYDVEAARKHMAPRESLGRSLEIRDLVILIVYQTQIPIPIPIFYKKMALSSVGPEGFIAEAAISFPKPELNLMKALRIVTQLKNLFTQGKDLEVTRPIRFLLDENYKPGTQGENALNLVFNAGPLYLRLPTWIATEPDGKGGTRGLTLGVTGQYQLLNLLNFAGILLNSVHHLFKPDPDFSYFLQSFDLSHRKGALRASLLGHLEAEGAWIAATPQEFTTTGWREIAATLGETHARSLLSVIPVEEGHLLNPQDKTAALVFLHGALRISNVVQASATAGMLLSGRRAGIGMRLAGSIGPELLTWLLEGAARIDENGILLRGQAQFGILGFNLLRGGYRISNRDLHIDFELLDENLSPVSLSGSVDGQFQTGLFHLEGRGKLRLMGLTAEVAHRWHFDDQENSISHSGKLELGALAGFAFSVNGENKGGAGFAYGMRLYGMLLSVVETEFTAEILGNPEMGLRIRGSEVIRLLGKELLRVEASLEKGLLSFQGELNLFPGLESIIELKVSVNGKLGNDLLDIRGSGHFRLGAFRLGARLDWYREGDRLHLGATIEGLLGRKASLSLSRNGDRLHLAGGLDGEVRLLNDWLQIRGTAAPGTGPSLTLESDAAGLQSFLLDGEVDFLGSRAGARVQWEKPNLRARFWHEHSPYPIQSRYHLDMQYSPTYFRVDTAFGIMVDLGAAFALLGQGSAPEILCGFQAGPFTIEVKTMQPPSYPVDGNLNARLAAAQAAIVAMQQMLQQSQTETRRALEELAKYETHARTQLGALQRETDTEKRRLIPYWERKLDECTRYAARLRDLESRLTNAVNQLAPLESTIAAYQSQMEDLNKSKDAFIDLYEKLWNTAKVWRHGPWESGVDYNVQYNQVLKPALYIVLMGFSWNFYSVFTQAPYTGSSELFESLQHEIYWSWFSIDRYRMHQDNALNIYNTVAGRLTTMHADIWEQWRRASETAGELRPQITQFRATLSSTLRAAEGFLSIAWLEERTVVSGSILEDNREQHRKQQEENLKQFTAESTDEVAADTTAASGVSSVLLTGDFTFRLPGIDRDFKLASLWWHRDRIDLSRPIGEWLPPLILEYVRDNFLDILYQAFNNIIDLMAYVISRLLPASNSDIGDPLPRLLAGQGGYDAGQAALQAYLKEVH